MGLALEIAFRVRKFVFISIRTCYRLVRNYPFIAGLLCFLILLYRSCPLLFSLLVSSSPVLICTAVLLGTLLSFGQPNIPEIETEEEKVSHDVASCRSGIFENATVVATEDGSFTVERFTGDKVESSFVETEIEDRNISEIDEHGGLVDFSPLIHESDREIHFEKREAEQAAERELDSSALEKRSEIYELNLDAKSFGIDGENAVENQYFLAQSTGIEILEVESRNISIEPVHEEDHLNLNLNRNDENDYDSSDHLNLNLNRNEDNDYDSSDLESESDGAESSSPDASMADIIPMLDELHPLLDLEAPIPVHRSNEESDATSEHSHKSEGECMMSDDDDDDDDEGEGGGVVDNDDVDDDDDDEEEEEEEDGMQGGKEDESKSAIKWTEDDQKNLMDLGTLELERNQRLENLIARRRTRNSLRMLAGKNLIDLDGFDLPVNVPPICTAKRNPFDLPYDSYHDMGLLPIPGSAPSILLPRRNPFDLPYDPNEEKPDLKGDDFEQEFLTSQQKDAFFRRHESFSMGPSSFGVPKQEPQYFKWRPYFMPEKIASEGTSYSPLERQFSEMSETKLSSVSDTESMSSIADQDDKKPDESQPYLETAAVSYLDHATSGIEHGNGSWEDENSEDSVQVENRDVHPEAIEITLGSTESHFESQSELSETAADTSMTLNANEIHPKNVVVENEIDYSSNSSLSSLSEVNEKAFEVKTDEVKPSSPHLEEAGISMKAPLEDRDFKITNELLDENQHKEPVYDSSPSAEGRLSSFSPSSSDVHAEITNMSSPLLVDTIVLSSGKESEVHHVIGKDIVQSPSIESQTGSEVLQDVDVKFASSGSSHHDVTPEVVTFVTEVEQEPMAELALNNCDEAGGSGILPKESAAEENSENMTPKVYQDISMGFSSMDSDSTSISSDNPDFQSPIIGGDVKDDIVDEIVREDVAKHLDYLAEAYGSHFLENVTKEEIDDIAEIDEGLLSELDKVGDFSIKEVGEPIYENLIQEEAQAERVELGLLPNDSNLTETEPELPILEARSIDDIKEGGEPVLENVIPEEAQGERVELGLLPNNSNLTETKLEQPILEARSIDDIKELREPVLEKVTPEEAQEERVELGLLSNNSNLTETKPELPILEARSIDDIKDVREPVLEKLTSEEAQVERVELGLLSNNSNLTETKPELPILEARSIDDIKEVGEPVLEKMVPEEAQAERVELGLLPNNSNLTETKSELSILEARSIDDIKEVGDFSTKEVEDFSIKDVGEPVLDKVIPEEAQAERVVLDLLPNNSNLTETKPELPILEARTIDDIKEVGEPALENVIPEEAQVERVESGLLPNNSNLTETKPELPIFEARSIDDVKEVGEPVLEKLILEEAQVESVELGLLPNNSNLTETKPELPILKERSIDDIKEVEDFSIKEVGEPVLEKVMLKEAPAERVELGLLTDNSNLTDTKPELPILEARSIDDINLAFRQLHEGVDVEEVILPSAVEDQVKEEAKVETVSNLEVVDARSLEDIHVALKQVSEKNIEELPTTSASKDQSVEVESLGADSFMDIASSNTTEADKPEHIIDEKSAHPDVTVSSTKDKKEKSGNSKSGSSSSSSSSSSDSD